MLSEFLFWIAFVVGLHLLVLIYVTRPKIKSIDGKHVLVTGGSSGIGLWIAIYCAQLGAHVTIVARNQGLLEKATKLIIQHRRNKTQQIQYKSVDLSKDYEAVGKVLDEAAEQSGPIYMLVNCAGYAICGTVDNVSIEDVHQLMNVNYFGTYYPTRHILTKMKAAKDGIIVITASQAAMLGIYGLGPYSAAKFALRGLAETLAMETRHCGVSVTLALPADTDTPGFENEQKSKPAITKIISGAGGLEKPENVAKQIVNDALAGSFFSVKGIESILVTIVCSGFAPWSTWSWTIFLAAVIGPLKLIAAVLQWNFYRIVKNHDAKKNDNDESKIKTE